MLADLRGVQDGQLVEEEVVTGLCDSVDIAVDSARHHHTLLPSGLGQHDPSRTPTRHLANFSRYVH